MLAEVRLPFARFLLLMPALEATYIQLTTDTKHCSGCSILQHIACKFSAQLLQGFCAQGQRSTGASAYNYISQQAAPQVVRHSGH